jgi:hypothetical protein
MIVDMGALPADVLGTARILGSAPVQTGAEQGKEVDAKLRALAPRTVRVSLRRPRRVSTPLGVPVIPPPPSAHTNGAHQNGAHPNGVHAAPPLAGPAPNRAADFSYDVTNEIVR